MIAQKAAIWQEDKTERSEQEEVRSKQSKDGNGKHSMSQDAKKEDIGRRLVRES